MTTETQSQAIDGELTSLIDHVIASLPRIGAGDLRRLRGALAQGGRPAIDDDAALIEMQRLIERGFARSPHEAAWCVAQTIGGQSVEANARRLRRKFLISADKTS